MTHLNIMELYVIHEALEARLEWLKEEGKNQEELPHIESALAKIRSLGVPLESGERT